MTTTRTYHLNADGTTDTIDATSAAEAACEWIAEGNYHLTAEQGGEAIDIDVSVGTETDEDGDAIYTETVRVRVDASNRPEAI